MTRRLDVGRQQQASKFRDGQDVMVRLKICGALVRLYYGDKKSDLGKWLEQCNFRQNEQAVQSRRIK